MAQTREQESVQTRVAFLYAGMPGAGKSTAANYGAQISGGQILKAGNLIRQLFREETGDDPDESHSLGEFAAQKREESGNGYFAEIAVGKMLRGEIEPDYPLHVDSVRHVDGIIEFKNYFDSTFVILVEAPFETRYERLVERGREGEAEFTELDLLQRDARELNELGTRTILQSDLVDVVIENDGSKPELRSEMQAVLNDAEAFHHGEL